jgi:hypothetical protein
MVGSTITISGHPFYSTDWVVYSTTGTALGGLTNGSKYYAYKVDNNNIKLGTSIGNLANSGYINITSSGTGIHSLTLRGPYIIISDKPTPALNQICQIMKVGYNTDYAGYILTQHYLGWDNTNKIPIYPWAGYRIETVDAGDFAYDFRGGTECMILSSRLGTAWDTAGMDTWTGDSNLLEGPDKSGVIRSYITAGSGVIVPVHAGEAAYFTSGEYYYICKLNTLSFSVDYSKVTYVDTVNDQVTMDFVYFNYPSGSIIGSYPHRYYVFGNVGLAPSPGYYSFTNANKCQIPYSSSVVSGYVFNDSVNSLLYGCIGNTEEYGSLIAMAPNDKGQYALERVNIKEQNRPNDSVATITGMNRTYGASKNTFITAKLTMSQGLDGRTYGGKNYIYLQTYSDVMDGGSANLGFLILDSESIS